MPVSHKRKASKNIKCNKKTKKTKKNLRNLRKLRGGGETKAIDLKVGKTYLIDETIEQVFRRGEQNIGRPQKGTFIKMKPLGGEFIRLYFSDNYEIYKFKGQTSTIFESVPEPVKESWFSKLTTKKIPERPENTQFKEKYKEQYEKLTLLYKKIKLLEDQFNNNNDKTITKEKIDELLSKNKGEIITFNQFKFFEDYLTYSQQYLFKPKEIKYEGNLIFYYVRNSDDNEKRKTEDNDSIYDLFIEEDRIDFDLYNFHLPYFTVEQQKVLNEIYEYRDQNLIKYYKNMLGETFKTFYTNTNPNYEEYKKNQKTFSEYEQYLFKQKFPRLGATKYY
uniref:Uncharacterized protein n=1 Tax=viral metagenome TaxID=1070528 RepID=A0A6C0F4M4_9ZZZZ